MEWINAFFLALAALGILVSAWEIHRIRQVLSDVRPLPWTALVEVRRRLAAGDDDALHVIEELMKERGEATVGDWLADVACAGVLNSLAGPPTLDRRPGRAAGRGAVAAPPSASVEANGRAGLHDSTYGQPAVPSLAAGRGSTGSERPD